MANLVTATLTTRTRLGTDAISTRVKRGRFDVCLVTYDATGRSRGRSLSGWLPLAEAVAFLEGMTPETLTAVGTAPSW